MSYVVIYTMDHCHFCEKAKALLKDRGIPFQEIRIAEDDDAKWDELYLKSRMRTMPQIFFKESLIGGFSELAKRDEQDQLQSLK